VTASSGLGIVGTIAGAVIGNLLLPGVGGIIGAAVGGMAGGAIGSAIDGGGPGVVGPRTNITPVTNASYGTVLPLAWGRVALPGSLIWNVPVNEVSTTTSSSAGGKGGPSTDTTTFSYFYTGAIAVCDCAVATYLRIWINGKLIRDTAGNCKYGPDIFVFYYGTEDQLPDPTIEAIKGADATPAYRGVSYLVFHNLPLADFGNSPALNWKIEIDTVAPAPPVPDSLGCIYRTPGSSILFDSFISASIPLELHTFGSHGWYTRLDSGSVETSLNGLVPVAHGGVYGGTYVAKDLGALATGGVMQNNTPPNYGIFSLPGDTSFGLTVEVHSPHGPGQVTVFATIPNSFAELGVIHPFAGGLLQMYDLGGVLHFLSLPIDQLFGSGDFYTMEFQTAYDLTAAQVQTCFYLQRSTDNLFLHPDGSWGSRTAVEVGSGLNVGVTNGVTHLLLPAAGTHTDFPTSAIGLNIDGFSTAGQVMTLQNLNVYSL
jgi:hypothetical protein